MLSPTYQSSLLAAHPRLSTMDSQLMDMLPVAIYVCDMPHGHILQYNRRAAELWGRRPDLGTTTAERFCGSFKMYRADGTPLSHTTCPMAEALRSGRSVRGQEVVIERPDGSRLHVVASIEILYDDDQNCIGALNAFQDITELKRAETEKSDSEARFRAILVDREEELKAIIENSPECVKVVAEDGTIERINAAGAKLLGADRPADVVGKPAWTLIAAEYRDAYRELHEQVCRGENAFLEYQTAGRNGQRRWMETNAVALPSPGGGFKHLAMTRDISQRHLSEQLLQRQKQVLEMIASGAPLGEILTVLCRIIEEQAGRDVKASILLLEEGRLVQGASPSLPPFYSSAIDGVEIGAEVGTCGRAAWLGEAVVTPDIQTCPHWESFRYLAKQAGLVAAWSMPIKSSQGKVLGVMATYLDQRRGPTPVEKRLVEILSRTAALAIERRQAEESLRQHAEEMADADRRKDEFLAMLAHELRNPLAPISNSLTILQRHDNVSEEVREYHDLMNAQVSHLVRLVDDLLDVSRITRGKITLQKEVVDLQSAVQRAIEGCRPLIESKRHQLEVRLPDSELSVEGDPVRLTQIVSNLLNNAAKYTPEEGRIEIELKHGSSRATLTVRDDGIGIAEEMLARIFDMFTQVDPSLTRSQNGLGIGLTLAQTFVKMHGGTLSAHSQGAGTGAEFVVTLPLADKAAGRKGTSDVASPPETPVQRHCVLVVDDTRAAAHLVGKLLEELQQEVHIANDAYEALKIAERIGPAIVLSDIAMPGMDGYELAGALRENPATKHALLVALTGCGQLSDQQRAHAAGFDQHLVKPVSFQDLRKLLVQAG